MTPHLVLLTGLSGQDFERLSAPFGKTARIERAASLADLKSIAFTPETSLVSFGSGVIVPAELLGSLSRPAYNLHAASPEFPGRDPHHHAVYRNAAEYGATLHLMTAKVDDGPIVGLETFPVTPGMTPTDLLRLANETGLKLIERHGARLLDPLPLPALPGIRWGNIKTRRSDLHRLSRISPLISEEEFTRRYRAFDGGPHDNLTTELHGRTFRIDKANQPATDGTSAFSEFTETGFRALLRQLKDGGYRFACYGDAGDDPHVIWRHDVDFSMHRAARLAEIEAEEGARATYFLNPRCVFYSLSEPRISRLVRQISDLGHVIGLHFDTDAYATKSWTEEQLLAAISTEKALLECMVSLRIDCISWHNPDLSNLLEFTSDTIGGLRNAYGARLRKDYAYASDSNGYWRFRPMSEVIAEGHPNLHLLTHPEWWTPEPLAPAKRLERAIIGRVRAALRYHEGLLAEGGRQDNEG